MKRHMVIWVSISDPDFFFLVLLVLHCASDKYVLDV